jgi:hypothetical protein
MSSRATTLVTVPVEIIYRDEQSQSAQSRVPAGQIAPRSGGDVPLTYQSNCASVGVDSCGVPGVEGLRNPPQQS